MNGEVRSWECCWGYWLSPEFLINVIKLTDFLQSWLYISIDFLKLFFWKRSFKIFILFHENFWKYLIHINSWNFVKLTLINHLDKIIHFLWIPEISRPYFEFHMLFLYLFYEIGEEQLHLILHCIKLWYFSVRVLVKNVLNFTPFHFFASLMEESTLFSILKTILADKTRFTTLRINAYH